jgi:arsenate reductase
MLLRFTGQRATKIEDQDHLEARPVRLSLIRIIAISALVLPLGCSVSKSHAQTHDSQVLFVCEHGNVKSLMAASYFNQLVQERRLPFRAVSRGTAPDSTTVPPAIIQGLRGDGFDVSSFHPSAVRASDVSASQFVITIGATLPTDIQSAARSKIEQWNDVPPASVDYAASRDSLKAHIKRLVEQLANR